MIFPNGEVTIAGAGPTGAMLAILMRRRGANVTLYERRPDPRRTADESGRSINLALADRGIHALRTAGVYEKVEPHLVPMRGRMIHDIAGGTSFQAYGRDSTEVIYSISRGRLNRVLLDEAIESRGAVVHFAHEIHSVDPQDGTAVVRDLEAGRPLRIGGGTLIAADGAGSAVRSALAALDRVDVRVDTLAHGYKELSIPAAPGGGYRLEREALHIWPRGSFMLIALPNADGSFTATLFLQQLGLPSFAALGDPAHVADFFRRQFADAAALMPDLAHEFQTHPTGSMATVYVQPWNIGASILLIGDAAHAIVPFHGQGMNCCFEDCIEFDANLSAHSSLESAFAQFARDRKPNTDAIAAMAIENYEEMRERVADSRFQLQKLLSGELEKRFPQRFIPRYSMVSFHHEIGYAVAARRGAIQQQILDELTHDAAAIGDIDFGFAKAAIEERLSPIRG